MQNNPEPRNGRKTAGIIALTAAAAIAGVSTAFWLGTSQVPKTDNNSNVIVQSSTIEKDLKIKGNRSSRIYHLPGCPNYEDIAERNIVWFKTHDEAQKAGFRMAKNC